jgi:hypothetical protein
MKADKDYCAPLPTLSIDTYRIIPGAENREDMITYYSDKIFSHLTQGRMPDEECNWNNRVHPQKEKWKNLARYTAQNLMGLVFGSAKTFEARSHTPTLNKDKINIQDIISIYKEKGEAGVEMHKFLFNYIAERIDTFEKYYTINHIYYPYLEELKKDCTFVPNTVPNELQDIFNYSERVAEGEI